MSDFRKCVLRLKIKLSFEIHWSTDRFGYPKTIFYQPKKITMNGKLVVCVRKFLTKFRIKLFLCSNVLSFKRLIVSVTLDEGKKGSAQHFPTNLKHSYDAHEILMHMRFDNVFFYRDISVKTIHWDGLGSCHFSMSAKRGIAFMRNLLGLNCLIQYFCLSHFDCFDFYVKTYDYGFW